MRLVVCEQCVCVCVLTGPVTHVVQAEQKQSAKHCCVGGCCWLVVFTSPCQAHL